MHNFKVGNTVRRIAGYHSGMSKGDTAKISGFCGSDLYLEGYGDSAHTWSNFELVQDEKETISKFLREQKWFIRTGSPEKSKLVQEWLFEHGMRWHDGSKHFLNYNEKNLSSYENTFGTHSDDCLCDKRYQEIKIEFETVVKSVQLPEILPNKTEQQLKIEQLQATIDKAQKELKELKELK